MILSSADILKILGRNEIIRLSATVSVVDGKPGLTGSEGVRIYVDRFPRVDEFQATWFIYIESDEDVELIVAELQRLLPSVKVSEGLLTTITTTDFLSESTQRPPEAPKPQAAQVDLARYEERFQELIEDVQDQMLLVNSGRPGKDGKDGLPGAPGRDGRDIDATKTELFDLADVSRSILPLQKGQVLTWDGSEWTNLYVRQVSTIYTGSSGGGDGEGFISDTAPSTRDDGSALEEGDQWWDSATGVMYVYYVDADSGQWVQSGGEGGGGSSTLAGLLDTDTSGVADGEILVYRSATGNWTAEALPDTGGAVSSVAGKTGAVTLVKADITDFSDADYATAAQGVVADTAIQPGDNLSSLVNDSGFITDAGVTQIVAGANITISPIDGSGVVTINSTATGGGGDVEEAPQDGSYYVRQDGAWVTLVSALAAIEGVTVDGGNFTTGATQGSAETIDGGVFT